MVVVVTSLSVCITLIAVGRPFSSRIPLSFRLSTNTCCAMFIGAVPDRSDLLVREWSFEL
jgi:hypothetical protein